MSIKREASSSNLIPIYVTDKYFTRRLTLRVGKRATVKDVKVMLEKLKGIPTHKQRLRYAGKQLEDLKSIFGDCKVEMYSTLVLVDTTRSKRWKSGMVRVNVNNFMFMGTTGIKKKQIHLDLTMTVKVHDVKLAIQDKIGIPPLEQQLFLQSMKLLDSDLLFDDVYGISPGDTVDLMPHLTGMISSFITKGDTVARKYLMLNDEDRNRVTLKKEYLEEIRLRCIAAVDGSLSLGLSNILTPCQREKLMKFMDQVHRDRPNSDLKIVFGDGIRGENSGECFGNLLDNTTAKKLLKLHDNEAKIVLRRTEAVDGCIDFHRDGGYATKTAQLTLNSDQEYGGGRLLFFNNGLLIEPKRPAGYLTIHSASVMHAVTRVTDGARYSLFVVDADNGLAGDSSNIQIIDRAYFQRLPTTRESRKKRKR